MAEDALIASLLAAVEAAPDDVPLRLHVAELLADRDRPADALLHCTQALAREPADPDALALLRRLTAALSQEEPSGLDDGFDWASAEEQVADIRVPEPGLSAPGPAPSVPTGDVERPALRLADVGGMARVTREIAAAVGRNHPGGMLLYGPPGCGRTFLARAVAGELGARFLHVDVPRVLGAGAGSDARTPSQIFATARRHPPCVLYLDRIDTCGSVEALLAEMGPPGDGGVTVLGATDRPWDLDRALRDRFDRLLLVLPPDAPARAAVLRHHLRDRPLPGTDLDRLVAGTEGFSGTDLARLCHSALARAGAGPLGTADLAAALREIGPGTAAWFATARTVLAAGDAAAGYDDLAAHLEGHPPR